MWLIANDLVETQTIKSRKISMKATDNVTTRLAFDATVLHVTNLEAISHYGQYFKVALYLQLHADLGHSLASHYVPPQK
jgi:hypothetical protein